MPSSTPVSLRRARRAGRLEHLLHAFAAARAQTESLVAPLSAEDCALQSMPDASPAKWHLAHTSWFFETFILERCIAGYVPFHPDFRMLFNSYYVGVGPRHPRPERGMLSRPSLDAVLAYRRHVDDAVLALLAMMDPADGALADTVELGIHHEQQHQELILTDLKHLLSRNPLLPVYVEQRSRADAGEHASPLRWIGVPGGLRQIGHEGKGFRFDNELPRHRVFTGDFQMAARPVTNGDYLQFIEDGGYQRPELWLAEGWDALMAQGWSAPLYWLRDGSVCRQFALSGVQPLEPGAPVCHVSYYEADAYARWAGARLPTEAEWEAFAADLPVEGNFLESGRYHPVRASPDAADGRATQVYGDVWEWTQSAYAPYPGYRPPAGAVGEYNGKFMVNQYVLRGGSCATPRTHIRPTYRNFFPAAARWQFSGIRLAREAFSTAVHRTGVHGTTG
jgi:ergothioneine biosynthesis protein EgtB